MNYDVVQLEEKMVAGIKIRTSNGDPAMSSQIGRAWQRFFEDGIHQSIPNKKNAKTIGLYTNYGQDDQEAYDLMVCCEIQSLSQLPGDVQSGIIPAGKYAKFIIYGPIPKAVAEFWTKLCSMNLDRKYGCDFEEYQGDCDGDKTEIHIYISLN